jgi:hypothetical protein
MASEADTVPVTSNLAFGVTLPMPTLKEWANASRHGTGLCRLTKHIKDMMRGPEAALRALHAKGLSKRY